MMKVYETAAISLFFSKQITGMGLKRVVKRSGILTSLTAISGSSIQAAARSSNKKTLKNSAAAFHSPSSHLPT